MLPRDLILILFLTNLFGIHCFLSLGVNFGASGVCCSLIDKDRRVVHNGKLTWKQPGNSASVEKWKRIMSKLFKEIPKSVRVDVDSVCISGSVGSALVYDTNTCSVSRDPIMGDCNILATNLGDDFTQVTTRALKQVKARIDYRHISHLPTSSLTKLVAWNMHRPLLPSERILHQSDYLTNYILNKDSNPSRVVTDWHNAHSLGFDAEDARYADILFEMFEILKIDPICLPKAVQPGSVVGTIDSQLVKEFGFKPSCKVIAGTVGNIAEFIGTGVQETGVGVTDLDDKLGFKLLSHRPVYFSKRGVHSVRFDQDKYLIEARSNAGCAVLNQHLCANDTFIEQMSTLINPLIDSKWKYYPLVSQGEIFPARDPEKMPKLSPVPMKANGMLAPTPYLHGLFESIARVERAGYEVFEEQGAVVNQIISTGKFGSNKPFQLMRERITGKSISPLGEDWKNEASFGTAVLGLSGLQHATLEDRPKRQNLFHALRRKKLLRAKDETE